MTMIPIAEAQKDLRQLVERALDGEEILIEAEGAATVKLAPVSRDDGAEASKPPARRPGRGSFKGLLVGPEFFELPGDEECGIEDGKGQS